MSPLLTDEHDELDVRNLLKQLMFRNRDRLVLRATELLIAHLGQLSDWTELDHSPARFLYESLAPIKLITSRPITYFDLAKAASDMPALYYRAQIFDYTTRYWDPMHELAFDAFVAQSRGLAWRCFETDQSAGDGKVLLARLLQRHSLTHPEHLD